MKIKILTKDEQIDFLPELKNISTSSKYDIADPSTLSVVFAAYDEDKIVAYAGLSCYYGFWALRGCVVHPKYRGMGLQRKLIKKRIEFLKQKGSRHVNVWVNPENSYSMNNVIAEGFKFVNEPAKKYHGKSHVKLRKILEN